MSFKALHFEKPLNSPTVGGLLNGAYNRHFLGDKLVFCYPLLIDGYPDYSSTIARLHYHSDRQCL
jgi:hypothetical protein